MNNIWNIYCSNYTLFTDGCKNLNFTFNDYRCLDYNNNPCNISKHPTYNPTINPIVLPTINPTLLPSINPIQSPTTSIHI